MNFPRIALISGQIPQTKNAGCLQLYRLLSEYPKDLIQIVGASPYPDVEILEFTYHTLKPFLRRLHPTRFTTIRRSLSCLPLWPHINSSVIDSLLEGFRPDVILTVFDDSDYYVPAYRYALKKKIPLALIIHDTNDSFETVFDWARPIQKKRDHRIYRHASMRACVSEEMKAYMKREHGVSGDVLLPCPDFSLQPRPFEETLKQGLHLTLGYTGALGYGYGEAIIDLLPAIRKSGSRITIISDPPQGACRSLREATDVVTLIPQQNTPADAYAILQQTTDALLLPYKNPPGKYKQLYSTHFPSKLADYCQMGMPIYVTGNKNATGVRWAHEHLYSHCSIPENETDVLKRLASSSAFRENFIRAAEACKNKYFQPDHIRNQFIALLKCAASVQQS